ERSLPLYSARYGTPPPPPHPRRPYLQFPPPPPYPPPDDNDPQLEMSDEETSFHQETHFHRLEGEMFEQECAEYSYAYYEPGPPTSHANFMVSSGANTRHERANRHTYVTRYGTEENIYEEISEVAAKQNNQSQLSLNQSVVEEEVRRVQSRHRRVLGELNLTVEAMLMPPPPSRDEESPNNLSSNVSGPPDLLEDLLMSVGPTDELLSPVSCSLGDHDSGFSGSSGTSYGFSAGSVSRRGGYLKFSKSNDSPGSSSKQKHPTQQNNSGFFGRKGWIKLPGFGSSSQHNKACLSFPDASPETASRILKGCLEEISGLLTLGNLLQDHHNNSGRESLSQYSIEIVPAVVHFVSKK
ncbi:hypothetical protein L9F63_019732, partial [Diploptera punctata]